MAIEGPLKELNINDVFQLLDLGRKTGVLRISSELRQNAGTVLFDHGAVVAAEIASNPHPLGALLVRAGRITEDEFARARALQGTGDGRRLGDILMDLGAITRRELERHLREQLEEVIFELMSWSEGYFVFEEKPVGAAEADAAVRIPTEALLMEAARRIDEWARIEDRIPHLGLVPRLTPVEGEELRPLDLVPFEWEVLAAVDGTRDLRALAAALGRSEFDVARTVYGLTAAGVLALDDPSAASADEEWSVERELARARAALADGDAERARAAVEALVAEHPELAPAYVLLARTHLRGRRFDEAAAALEEAIRLEPRLPEAHRLLGLAQAGLGRFEDAADTWIRWTRLGIVNPDEEALADIVGRWRGAAETFAEALRGRHV